MFTLLRKTSLKPFPQKLPSLSTSHFTTTISNPTTTNNNNELTAASYDTLIQTAANSNDFTTITRLLNNRNKDRIFNTSKTFNFVTESYLNTNLDNLIQTLTNLDKGFTRKNAFDSLIIHLCKSKKIEESLKVIRTMIQNEISVNSITFYPVLSVASKESLDQGRKIIEVMIENKICVDVTAYNYVLTACCYQGDLTQAAEVLETMLKRGVKVDSRTYDALIMGACRVGKVEVGLKLLRKMEEERVSTMYCSHTHVVKSLVGLGCFQQAIEFVRIFKGKDKGLDDSSFAVLLNSFVKKKAVKEAEVVFKEIENGGLVITDKLRKEYEMLIASKTN